MARFARRGRQCVVAGGIGVGLTLLGATPVSAGGTVEEAPPVGVVLSSDDEPPGPGEEVVFRTIVANEADDPVEGALLAQHVPEDMEIVEVGQGGVVEQGIVNWLVDVAADRDVEYTVRARLADDARPGRQMGSTACLLLERENDPTACATDAVEVSAPTITSRVGEVLDARGLVPAAGAGILILLLWVLWRRREALGIR